MLVGAGKAGTTSLYSYLSQHPQVFMSPIKEPSYFAAEFRPDNFAPPFRDQMRRQVEETQTYLRAPAHVREETSGQIRLGGPVVDWEDYLRLFRDVEGATAVGEASVSYLWS